jgi:hypothetical protein
MSFERGSSVHPPLHGVELNWRTSSFSQNVECVEVAYTGQVVLVRDTKHRELSHLAFSASHWLGFTAAVRRGEFDKYRAVCS